MLRALLSIAIFTGLLVFGSSAFALTVPEKSQRPETQQIAQVKTEHPAEAVVGDDKGVQEKEVRQEHGVGEAGEDAGREAELRGRAAEGEQEIENEAEHQHRGRDGDHERGRNRGQDKGQDRGQDRGRDRQQDSGRHGGGHN